MFLFSSSANLEIDVPAAWTYPAETRGQPLDFTIDGIDFEVTASGFGSKKSALEGALTRVQMMMAACTADELQDHAVIEAVAATAVRRETRGWACWKRGSKAAKPSLTVCFA
ncbi:MAG TPA: hypothetical protein VEC14_05530 [Reyranellaceae bacterium]|nr:hypothetical protein [Reyranellaceae bacterium]